MRNKEAYVIVDGFLEIWEYPFNKTISSWKEITLKKIFLTSNHLFGYTPDNSIQIYDIQNMKLITEHKSNLLIIHDMIVTDEMAIMISNTNCMEQWNYKPYLEFLSQAHTEAQN